MNFSERIGAFLDPVISLPVAKYPQWLRRTMVLTFPISFPLLYLLRAMLWAVALIIVLSETFMEPVATRLWLIWTGRTGDDDEII